MLIDTDSSVLRTDYELFTDESFLNINFTDSDIGRIIRGLDPNEVHGHNITSIGMLKICREFIYKPLRLIFRA